MAVPARRECASDLWQAVTTSCDATGSRFPSADSGAGLMGSCSARLVEISLWRITCALLPCLRIVGPGEVAQARARVRACAAPSARTPAGPWLPAGRWPLPGAGSRTSGRPENPVATAPVGEERQINRFSVTPCQQSPYDGATSISMPLCVKGSAEVLVLER
jgi:hypothetical protein